MTWQSAQILFPLTLASLAFFGINDEHSPERFAVIVVVALGAILLLSAWFLITRRWNLYQKIAFHRMREIEEELGFWFYRYAHFAQLGVKERLQVVANASQEEKERYNSLPQAFVSFPRFGTRGMLTFLFYLFMSSWMLLIVREFIQTFITPPAP